MAKKKAVTTEQQKLNDLDRKLNELEDAGAVLEDFGRLIQEEADELMAGLEQYSKDLPKSVNIKPAVKELKAIFKGMEKAHKIADKANCKEVNQLENTRKKLAAKLDRE